MSDLRTMAGFKGGQSFQFKGLDSVPGWVDKGWASYSAGPALAVPVGDPFGQPYTTKTANIGDYVFSNKDGTRFHVVTAAEMGDDPGDVDGDHESNLPPQTSQATLEDLTKQGLVDPNEDQLAQLAARGTEAQAGLDNTANAAPQKATTKPASEKTTPAKK